MSIKSWADFLAASYAERTYFIKECRLRGMGNKAIAELLHELPTISMQQKITKHCRRLGLSPERKADNSPRNTKGQDSLCWSCANAYNGCSWSRNFEPVEGWKAEVRKKTSNYSGSQIPDYFVLECPEYTEDLKFTAKGVK